MAAETQVRILVAALFVLFDGTVDIKIRLNTNTHEGILHGYIADCF